jgi:hypothetical protein
MQIAEFGRQIICGVIIVAMPLLYGRGSATRWHAIDRQTERIKPPSMRILAPVI